ncbi:MAG TPA: TAXI family TRAP transporter solute-binding subunit [Methylomirabilota bacterium]
MWRTSTYAVVSTVFVMAIVGCSRGPDAGSLRAEVQGKLDQRFKPGLFALVGLKRQGSAPLPGAETGAKRLAVYFNATLKLTQGYDFGNWEGLSAGTLAQVLGATEKGIIGVKPAESRPGDVIKVYGSSTYEWVSDRWQGVEAATVGVAKTAAPGNAAPPSRSRQLIDKLAALVDIPPPGPGSEAEEVVSDELDRALRAITARLARRKQVYVFASGPEAGEYHPIVESVVARVRRLDKKIKVRNLTTEGSVQNARLILANEVDYALIQSNVAAMAVAGEGPFAAGGPVISLRALGSLFPEPVHIVVSAESGIRGVADLKGKRVAIGARDSGTRADALAVLSGHGLDAKDLVVSDEGLEAAAAGLRAGRLDAFFATVGAPTAELQRLATRHPIRVLSLDANAIGRLVTQHPGLVRLLLPANTYPGQKEDVTTVAATALLVTHADVPEREAELVLRLVFENPDYVSAGSAQGAKIAKRSGLRGITIPVHPAASRYFGSAMLGGHPWR